MTNTKSTTGSPMSLRWTAYTLQKPPPRGRLKNAKWPFSVKKGTCLEESLLESLC